MKITEWLSKITDFVNLGSLVTNTGAGTLLAIALAIVAAQLTDLPILTAPVEDSAYHQRLQDLQDEIEEQAEAYSREVQEFTKEKGELAKHEAEKTRLTEARAELEAELNRQAIAAHLSGGSVDERLAPIASALEETKALVVETQGRLEAERLQQEQEQKTLQELYERRNSIREEEVNTLSELFTLSINHLVALLLLGWLLGTLVNPIANTLFLSDQTLSVQLMHWLFGAPPPSARADGAEIWERFLSGLKSLTRQDVLALAYYYPSSYFLGLGVVSQSEVDALGARYFRWLDVATQLILPIVALFAATFFVQDEVYWIELWTVVGVAWLLVGFFTAALRYRKRLQAELEVAEDWLVETQGVLPPADAEAAAAAQSLLHQVQKSRSSFFLVGAAQSLDRVNDFERLLLDEAAEQRAAVYVPEIDSEPVQPTGFDWSILQSRFINQRRMSVDPEVLRSTAPEQTVEARTLHEQSRMPVFWHAAYLLIPAAMAAYLTWRNPASADAESTAGESVGIVVACVLVLGAWAVVWTLHRLVRQRRIHYEGQKRSFIEARLLHLVRAAKAEGEKEHELVTDLKKQLKVLKALLEGAG